MTCPLRQNNIYIHIILYNYTHWSYCFRVTFSPDTVVDCSLTILKTSANTFSLLKAHTCDQYTNRWNWSTDDSLSAVSPREQRRFKTIVPWKNGDHTVSTGSGYWTFVTWRTQSVRLNSLTPSWLRLSTGAPQGCALRPLLYTPVTTAQAYRVPAGYGLGVEEPARWSQDYNLILNTDQVGGCGSP